MVFFRLVKYSELFLTKTKLRFHSSWSGRELPRSFDWRDHRGVLSRSRNQGNCASCWAFSVTHAIQASLKLKRGVSVLLSKQELVDCVYHKKDCGGWASLAYEYIHKFGIAIENYYPYEDAYNRPCRGNQTVGRRVYIDGFARCGRSERDLMRAVLKQPISVALCAGIELIRYRKGDIFDKPACHIIDKEDKLKVVHNVNHFALLVGYGSKDGKDYWVIQNSWGEEWGDKGFFLLKRNSGRRFGQCKIAKYALYPIIHGGGKRRFGRRPDFRGFGGKTEEDNGGDSFKREMRDSEELLSKLNAMAEAFLPPSLTNNQRYLVAGPAAEFGYPNNLMLLNDYANANGQTNQRRKNGYATDEESAGAAVSLFRSNPLRVLPSKTAITPFNPTFLPRSEDEREMCSRTIYCTNIDQKSEDEREMCSRTIYCRNIDQKAETESAIAALSCSDVILGALPAYKGKSVKDTSLSSFSS